VTRELRQRGLKCGQNRIARLMRENELAARAKKALWLDRGSTIRHQTGMP
jgi:hypothetical protein